MALIGAARVRAGDIGKCRRMSARRLNEQQSITRDVSPSPSALLLRIREAATLLSVSERQVWVLLRSGQLTAIHPPGIRAVRIARDDVERLVTKWCAGADVR